MHDFIQRKRRDATENAFPETRTEGAPPGHTSESIPESRAVAEPQAEEAAPVSAEATPIQHRFGAVAVVPRGAPATPAEPNSGPPINVTRPDDPSERAAEAAADQVTRAGDVAAAGKSGGPRPARAPRGVTPAGGEPLDPATRAFMEPQFGFDFSQVRVRADPPAAAAARALSARAYTLGAEVVFGEGEYAPDTREGRKLIAHELTHVVQQASSMDRSVIQRQVAPPPATMPPPAASAVSVRVKVTTGPDPEYTSNSRNSGSGIVVFSTNAEETYASLRQLGIADMWNMACVVGNLSNLAATAPDTPDLSSPGGGPQASNPDPADDKWEEKYRTAWPPFKQHVRAFYKSFKDFEKDFEERGTKATLGIVAESRARTQKTLADLGIAPHTETERGPLGAEPTTTYQSSSPQMKQLVTAATQLADKQEALDKAVKADKDREGFIHWAIHSKEERDRLDKELPQKVVEARQAWLEERGKALAKYPVLSHFDTAAKLRMLSTEAAAAHGIGSKLYEVLDNIKELEDRLKASNKRILTHAEHCNRLKDAFALSEFQRHVVNYMQQKHTGDIETGQKTLVLIAIVLAAIAAAPGGGFLIAAAALGEAGINTMLLLQAYDEYAFEKAAAGSDEDKAKTLSSDEPSFGWLAFQVVQTLAGLKGNASTVMKELKAAYQEIKQGYKIAAVTGKPDQLKGALKARNFSESASEGIVARALKESVAILEGVAKGGPDGIAAALEMLKASPNFYAIRLAVWQLKAQANPGVVRGNLQAARQQAVNQIVNDMKGRYPKTTWAVVEEGYEKPIVVRLGSSEPAPSAPPPATPAKDAPPPSAPPSSGGPDTLPSDVQGTPVVSLPSGLLVQAQGSEAAAKPITPGAWDFSQGAPPASPLGSPSAAPSSGGAARGPVAPGAASVSAPGGFHPPMAIPEGVNQALNAADELRVAPQASFGSAPVVSGADLAVQFDTTVAPFGPMNTPMQVYYLNPNVPKPDYKGIYLTVSKRFEVNPEMSAKFKASTGTSEGKGTSHKVILQDSTGDPATRQLYMFKAATGEHVGVAKAHQVRPGTFYIAGRASYDIALELPTVSKDIVPLAVVVYDGQIGSLQPFKKGTENLYDLAHGKPLDSRISSDMAKQMFKEIWEVNPEFARFRENLRAYDHIINNPDRNIGNYMVELKEDLTVGRFYAIDQDLALKPGARTIMRPQQEALPHGVPSPFDVPNQVPGLEQRRLGKISQSMYDELLLMKVNEASVREALHATYGLDKATLDGIFMRTDEVLRDYNLRLKTMPPGEVFSD